MLGIDRFDFSVTREMIADTWLEENPKRAGKVGLKTCGRIQGLNQRLDTKLVLD